MGLNHPVPDVRYASDFLQMYFGLVEVSGNLNMAFLRDDQGMNLTLTHMKIGGEVEVRYPSTFHIGFIQPDKQAVNDSNSRLVADGFDVPAPSSQHGSWTFYFTSPGGVTIEVLA